MSVRLAPSLALSVISDFFVKFGYSTVKKGGEIRKKKAIP
jgi:hypothetical protein